MNEKKHESLYSLTRVKVLEILKKILKERGGRDGILIFIVSSRKNVGSDAASQPHPGFFPIFCSDFVVANCFHLGEGLECLALHINKMDLTIVTLLA